MLIALLAYYVVLLVVIFAWPTWRLWRREQVNALVLPRDDTAEGVIGVWFKVLIAAVATVVTGSALGLSPSVMWKFSLPGASALDAIGWVLLSISLVTVTVAQSDMGPSWRIGIDYANTPSLARKGLFRWSRNPIFLGLRGNLIGLFLLLPNAVTLAILLVSEALMQVQVRLEEHHLTSLFGDEYADYCRGVRRWL